MFIKKKTVLDRASKIWLLITVIFLALGLIGNSIYQEKKEQVRQQKIVNLQARIQELQEQAQQQYHLQNSPSTTCLVQSPVVHAFFTDLLTTYAEKLARSKGLSLSLPLEFGGFYSDPKTGNDYREMGRCSLENMVYPIKQKVASISLNHLYLLNKFGCEKYFTGNPEYEDYSYLDISFDKMLETCSHELTHYLQYIKHGKSSCESDLILGNRGYNQLLTQEHKEFTQEIYGMIKREYSEWEKQWREI